MNDEDRKLLHRLETSVSNIATGVAKNGEDIRQLEHSVDTRLQEFKSDILTGVDKVLKEVITIRQEQAAHQVQHEDIQEDLTAIKAVPAVAHELSRKK